MSGFINIFLLTKNQKARFTHIFVILVKSPMEVLRIKHLRVYGVFSLESISNGAGKMSLLYDI